MVRLPAVAGRFYPSDPDELAGVVDRFCAGPEKKIRAIACVVPHAGYVYSGSVAGQVYGELEVPRRCILLGPRHFPRGQALAILTSGSWATPLGEASIDSELASALAHECKYLREDSVAHESEHSLEVQIPFLRRLVPEFRFVPVVIGTDRYGVLEDLGRSVAKVIAAQKESILVIASSDMNHYENDVVTRAKDERAIERILALDAKGLYDRVRNEGITMCGYAATVAMLIAAKELGATEAKLVRYATSGDVNGDRERVVGYAGIIVR
jgi:AmmeMemoRadiSam system protein B